MSFIDLTGKKFNRLTVLSRAENDKYGRAQWNCFCECGKSIVVKAGNLKYGNTKGCGCLQNEPRKGKRDLTGITFGKLTVVKRAKSNKRHSMWECLCACGNTKIAAQAYLLRGGISSCGCLKHARKENRRTMPDYVNEGEWRMSVLDDAVCSKCGTKENLQSHHLYSVSLYPYLRRTKYNGVALCAECHKDYHRKHTGYCINPISLWDWIGHKTPNKKTEDLMHVIIACETIAKYGKDASK